MVEKINFLTPDEFMRVAVGYQERTGFRSPVARARIIGGDGSLENPYLFDRDQLEVVEWPNSRRQCWHDGGDCDGKSACCNGG